MNSILNRGWTLWILYNEIAVGPLAIESIFKRNIDLHLVIHQKNAQILKKSLVFEREKDIWGK